MAIKQRPDSPTNNFATLNPLKQQWNATRILKEGNLLNYRVSHSSSTATLIFTGKHYWEVYSTYGNQILGVIDDTANQSGITYSYDANSARGIYNNSVQGYVNGSGVVTTGGPIAGYTTSSVIMFAVDIEAGKMWVGKDGVWNGDPDAGTNPFWTNLTSGLAWTPWVHSTATDQANDAYFNFGQDPTFGGSKNTPATVNGVTGPFAPSGDAAGTAGLFYYPPPAGALALCTANLSEMTPTVDDDVPKDYFKTVLWTGQTTGGDMTWDGTTGTGTVTVGFQPDLVWGKNRDFANDNEWTDSVRGATRSIYSNTSGTEGVNSEKLKSFDSNGFSIGNAQGYNKAGDKHVAWCFRAGGSPSAPDDGNGISGSAKLVDTSGTASSTTCKAFKDAAVTAGASNVICPSKMSINQAAGFSIVKYTGTGSTGGTVPHGLSAAPEMVICKTSDTVSGTNWVIYFKGATTNSQYLLLNTSGNVGNYSNYWGTAEPTNNVFSVAAAEVDNNHSNANIIAYCWHSVEGYSKFGSYTGNGSVTGDGPFVYTGFRPAFVLIKSTSSGGWSLWDSARNPHNVTDSLLQPYNADYEYQFTSYQIDMLSNGFKIKNASANTSLNASATQYIYMAFAEQPFNYANAR